MQPERIQQIIEQLGLRPLEGEGGLIKETYRSAESETRGGLPGQYTGAHPYGTAIYYALTDDPGCFSALHRLVTDEIYHFYLGDPVEMLLLKPNGSTQQVTLGSDVLNGQVVQLVVPADTWQGACLKAGGRFALMGTTMAPGFIQADFCLGERAALQAAWPEQAARISRLTRI